MTNFPLLNPDIFFDASGPAQKAVLVPFLGVVFMTFFFSFFFIPGRFQWGFVFGAQNSKI